MEWPSLYVEAYPDPKTPFAVWTRGYSVRTDRSPDGRARLTARLVDDILPRGAGQNLQGAFGLDDLALVAQLYDFHPHGGLGLGRTPEVPFMRMGTGKRVLDAIFADIADTGVEWMFVAGATPSMVAFCLKYGFKPFDLYIREGRAAPGYFLRTESTKKGA